MLIEKYPVSKGSILYDFIYITFSIWHNYGDGEEASGSGVRHPGEFGRAEDRRGRDVRTEG